MLTCRLAEPDDFLNLGELRWDFANEDDSSKTIGTKNSFATEFAEWAIQNSNYSHFIATIEDKIVSMVSLYTIYPVPRPRSNNMPIGYLTNTFTLPEYRNKGIGAQLLYFVKNWANSKQFDTIIVWPSDKSIRFYERSGFENENEIMEMAINPEL